MELHYAAKPCSSMASPEALPSRGGAAMLSAPEARLDAPIEEAPEIPSLAESEGGAALDTDWDMSHQPV